MNREELIFKNFDFLINEFGYNKFVVDKHAQKGVTVVIYESLNLKKRIEIAISQNEYYYVVIRYLLDNKYADYSDKLYSIDMNVLSILKYGAYDMGNIFNMYDKHFLEKTVALFSEYKSFLSSERWIDIDKYIKIMDEHYLTVSGDKWAYRRLSIQQEFENEVIRTFPDVKILYNSEKQPPYDYSAGWNTAKYEINGHIVVFRLPDWRDCNLYDVIIDNTGGYQIDTRSDYKKDIQTIMKHIKNRCGG